MNRNMVIVLVCGVLIAVLVAVLVQAGLGGKKKGAQTAMKMTKIIVATRDLSPGTDLTDADMRWQEWPDTASSRIPGMVKDDGGKKPSELLKGRLLYPVQKDSPILTENMVKQGTGNFVAASLGDGMRAVAINVDPAKMVAGFVGPGDYVDVMLTYRKNIKVPNSDDPRVDEMLRLTVTNLATETILQNVKVLAVDQLAKRVQDAKSDGKTGKTVTLEVTPRGAETMALASQAGQLSLSLRKLGDTSVNIRKEPIVTDERVTHITREVYDQAHKIAGQNSNIVRIYNGYTVEDQATVSP